MNHAEGKVTTAIDINPITISGIFSCSVNNMAGKKSIVFRIETYVCCLEDCHQEINHYELDPRSLFNCNDILQYETVEKTFAGSYDTEALIILTGDYVNSTAEDFNTLLIK